MGSVCCVASKDVPLRSGSRSDSVYGNVRYSPSWSFRWDNRGRVAGEVETSFSSFSDGLRSSGLENKSGTHENSLCGSEVGTPLETLQAPTSQKSSIAGKSAIPFSDQAISRNVFSDVKECTEFAVTSTPSPSSLTASLSSSNCQPFQKMRDERVQELKSSNNSPSEEKLSNVLPMWTNESNRGSHGGSSDNWSMNAFLEPMFTSKRGRWSFDSESLGDSKITRCSSRVSDASSLDLRTCGVCSKLLIEKSSCGSQKFVRNEISVVSVLICGHVYHAECLEYLTPESDKYDPLCPVCTLGEKQTVKLCERPLKSEIECKAKVNKRSKNLVVDKHFDEDFKFDYRGSKRDEGNGDMGSCSTKRRSFEKPPFLKHFTFGSKGTRSISEHPSSRKRGFLWTKSSRE